MKATGWEKGMGTGRKGMEGKEKGKCENETRGKVNFSKPYFVLTFFLHTTKAFHILKLANVGILTRRL